MLFKTELWDTWLPYITLCPCVPVHATWWWWIGGLGFERRGMICPWANWESKEFSRVSHGEGSAVPSDRVSHPKPRKQHQTKSKSIYPLHPPFTNSSIFPTHPLSHRLSYGQSRKRREYQPRSQGLSPRWPWGRGVGCGRRCVNKSEWKIWLPPELWKISRKNWNVRCVWILSRSPKCCTVYTHSASSASCQRWREIS